MKLEMVDVKSEDSVSSDEIDDSSTTRSSFGASISQAAVSPKFPIIHILHKVNTLIITFKTWMCKFVHAVHWSSHLNGFPYSASFGSVPFVLSNSINSTFLSKINDHVFIRFLESGMFFGAKLKLKFFWSQNIRLNCCFVFRIDATATIKITNRITLNDD